MASPTNSPDSTSAAQPPGSSDTIPSAETPASSPPSPGSEDPNSSESSPEDLISQQEEASSDDGPSIGEVPAPVLDWPFVVSALVIIVFLIGVTMYFLPKTKPLTRAKTSSAAKQPAPADLAGQGASDGQSSGDEDSQDGVVSNSSGVALKSDPGDSNPSLMIMPNGSTFRIVGKETATRPGPDGKPAVYIKIRFNSTTGWVLSAATRSSHKCNCPICYIRSLF